MPGATRWMGDSSNLVASSIPSSSWTLEFLVALRLQVKRFPVSKFRRLPPKMPRDLWVQFRSQK